MQDRICEVCGSDTFKTKDYDKVVSERIEISSRFKKLNAQHALEKAEWQLREITLEQSMRYMQRKTKSQTSALRKLEERVKRLGDQPYSKLKTVANLEPGDLLLDGTVVITRIEYDHNQIIITGQIAPTEKKENGYTD